MCASRTSGQPATSASNAFRSDFGLALQPDLREHGHREPQRLGGKIGVVAADQAGLLERAHAAQAGGGEMPTRRASSIFVIRPWLPAAMRGSAGRSGRALARACAVSSYVRITTRESATTIGISSRAAQFCCASWQRRDRMPPGLPRGDVSVNPTHGRAVLCRRRRCSRSGRPRSSGCCTTARPGMASQALGLAEAAGFPFVEKPLAMRPAVGLAGAVAVGRAVAVASAAGRGWRRPGRTW